MSQFLFGRISGLCQTVRGPSPGGTPLVIAIHGGTYTSRYFDVPGHSLLARAAANGIPLLAIDRPMYGETPALANGEAGLAAQAEYLRRALVEGWDAYGDGCSGVVLIGHSIGAAIAALIAGDPGELPLIGLALSGVGLRTPPDHTQMWASLPDLAQVELPGHVKDHVMFGPAGSFDAATMPRDSHLADALVPKEELLDIVSTWQNDLVRVLGRIAVPVHYRQAEIDRLWIVDEGEVSGFARALSASPRVDAAMMRGVGHCIDFHHVAAAFHLQQLGFALQCAADATARSAVSSKLAPRTGSGGTAIGSTPAS